LQYGFGVGISFFLVILFFLVSPNTGNGSVPPSIHFLPKTLFLEHPSEKKEPHIGVLAGFAGTRWDKYEAQKSSMKRALQADR
jgi:hypothetical protein